MKDLEEDITLVLEQAQLENLSNKQTAIKIIQMLKSKIGPQNKRGIGAVTQQDIFRGY